MSRHVVTAGHCICAPRDDKSSAALCLNKGQNQIQYDENTIVVAGGHKSAATLDNPTWKLRWDIDFAYIIDQPRTLKHDLGILELDATKYSSYNQKRFFKHDDLIIDGRLKHAKIVPICLGALDLRKKFTSDTEVIQLGWGDMYQESPSMEDNEGIRDPTYSSCMTSKASHHEIYDWRFQNCDMKRMKKRQRGRSKKDIWECEKTLAPPDYEKEQDKKCENYFDIANNIDDDLEPETSISETRMKNIDFIYVENCQGEKEKCFNPDLLSEFGWCYLNDFKEKKERKRSMDGTKVVEKWQAGEAWGICSPSCRYMKVSKMKYTNIHYRDIKFISYKYFLNKLNVVIY